MAKPWWALAPLGLAAAAVTGAHLGLANASSLPAAEVPILAEPEVKAGRTLYRRTALPTLTVGDGRQRPVLSLLKVKQAMNYGDWKWDDHGVSDGKLWVRVDLKAQTMSVFRGGHEIGTAVVLYGAPEKPTPSGTYPILQRIRHHHSAQYDAPMPYTLRLTTDGIAIHASNVRFGAATHGCIGIPEGFAAKLFEQARAGDEVSLI